LLGAAGKGKLVLGAALALLAGGAAFAGMVLAPTIILSPAPGQTVETYQGKPTLKSDGRVGAAVLILTTQQIDAGGGPVFIAGVKNAGPSPIVFDTKNVTITTDAGTAKILTLEALQQAARREDSLTQQHGGDQIALARLPGSNYLTLDYSRRLADQRVRAEEAKMSESADRLPKALAAAEAIGFKPLNLEPGQTLFTPMALSPIPKSATRIQIVITLNDEPHSFAYTLARTH
jgi:hypothetical protein